jgi:hypothetical protein
LKPEFLRTAGNPDCSSTSFQSGGQGSYYGDLYTLVALLEVEPIQMLGSTFTNLQDTFQSFFIPQDTFHTFFLHYFVFFCWVETVEIVLTNQPVSLTWFSACAGHPGNVAKKNPFVTWIYIYGSRFSKFLESAK